MDTYYVEIPITGFIHTEIDANNEKEALEKFYKLDWKLAIESNQGVDLGELDMHENLIVDGKIQTYHTKAFAEKLLSYKVG
jgi:hypothetical protein